jgi:hypothetical protein
VCSSDLSAQSWNAYSYVLNNPLTYTDPTGMFSWSKWWRPIVAIVATAITYGAASGWAAGWLGSNAVAIGAFAVGSNTLAIGAIAGGMAGFVGGAIMSGTLKGALQGAVAGAITGGVLNGTSGWNWAPKAFANGLAGGTSADILGGSFKDGFKFAFLASVVKSGLDAYDSYRMQRNYSSSADPASEGAVYKPNEETQRILADPNSDPTKVAGIKAQLIAAGCDSFGDVCNINATQMGRAVGTSEANLWGKPVLPGDSNGGWLSENGRVMSYLGTHLPGGNAFPITHDFAMGDLQRWMGGYSGGAKMLYNIINPITIAPVAALQYYGFGVRSYWYDAQLLRRKD